MPTEREHKIQTLDHMVDEKFAEIFFLAKEEYDIEGNSDRERQLYEKLNSFKRDLREFGGAL
jgi:hypothetical protein